MTKREKDIAPRTEAEGHIASAQLHFFQAMKQLSEEKPVVGMVNTRLLMAVYEQNAAILCLLMEGRKPCE